MAKRRTSSKRKMSAQQKKLSSVLSVIVFIIAALIYYWPEIETMLMSDVPPAADPVEVVADGEAEVYFFDVGQGDSALIRIEDYTMLIDASVSGAAEEIMANLDALGVTELDVVVATHPHADHIGGMTDIINAYPIGTFYMPVLPDSDTPTTRTYENMLDALSEQDVNVKQITDETKIPAPEGAAFDVLSPYDGDNWDETNDYSAVIRFTYGEVSFMLTGDAESPVEERILDSGKDISSMVLKCGHHGSSSSTTPEFLRAVNPAVAIISCAEENDYGHPHRETMASLNEQGCKVMQTWDTGTVLIITDGTAYSVNTWSIGAGMVPAA